MTSDHMDVDSTVVRELANLSLDTHLEDLIAQTKSLLTEVDTFIAHLKAQPRLDKVEYRHFRSDIKNELAALIRLQQKGLSPEKTFHTVKSSNLPFLQAVWDTAKRSRGVVSLKRHSKIQDVVAQGGLQWIKLSLVSEKRLLHEMAKQGWEWGAFSDSDSDDQDSDSKMQVTKPIDELPDISIVKAAEALANLAKETRVKYKHPSVIYILPNITSGRVADVDNVINMIRNLDIRVLCAEDISPAPPLSHCLPNPIVHDHFSFFTPTLNIDCTILLALVSDISHASVPEEDWFNKAVRRQLAAEDLEKLMPNVLWPAMSNRSLECTDVAAKRMREITAFIGTSTEKQRMDILLGEGPWRDRGREELLQAFAGLTSHTVPDDWQMPIRVMDGVDEGVLPPLVVAATKHLTAINRSVCLYGWIKGYTTITSNRTTAKSIERMVEEHRMSDEDAGPDIWVCWTSRSLVAKEKESRRALGSNDL